MKKRILTMCLSIVLVSTVMAIPTKAATDEKVYTDGKVIIKYPISNELKAQINVKEKLSKEYMKYKIGNISFTQYKKAENIILKDQTQSMKKSLAMKHDVTLQTSNNGINVSRPNVDPTKPGDVSSAKRIRALVHIAQERNYYCGPATAAMIIKARGSNYSQSTLANSLGTTASGTAWCNGRYPMADTLNKYAPGNNYLPYGTTVDANTFSNHIIWTIDKGFGVAGNAYEVTGGPHLDGHPNKLIYHWFAIDGYKDYGNTIWYVDPASGGKGISWGSNVPKYSNMNYKTLARIVNGRGIVW